MALCSEGSAGLPGFGSEPCEIRLDDAALQELPDRCAGPSSAADEDELCYSAPMERVQAVAEQVEEFLARFSPRDRRAIQEPFLLEPLAMPPTAPTSPVGFCGNRSGLVRSVQDGSGDSAGASVAPHIDEARQFVHTYLAMYPENEQFLALARIGISSKPSALNRSSSSVEFLNMRRKVRLAPMRKVANAHAATRELIRLKALRSQQTAKPELQRVVETFQCCDKEGSGTISREELACALKMLNPMLVERNLDGFLARRWCGDNINYAAFAAWVFQGEAPVDV